MIRALWKYLRGQRAEGGALPGPLRRRGSTRFVISGSDAEYDRLAAERTRLIVEHGVDHRDLIEPIPTNRGAGR